ncbi:sporulation-control protein [Stackebrandtia albiflava]|uniref:Sporulation-control protein n=1 Tax=Stackebrandtia albiflava TaxID=406432 RepID=A0A562VEV5_9ACTN|nr:sporulation protein [Stackebrandtia albiflava]TWJ16361.1 sporulation-control protein [Stackebrandtia albiflava]
MVFRKLKAAFGAGVSVDTVLAAPHVTPGSMLQGEVRFTGGGVDYRVQGITIEFNAVVEVESGDNEYRTTYDFLRAEVAGPFSLECGAAHAVPFQIQVPWETPLSSVAGHHLPGMRLGVATELKLEGALDKGDMDPLVVEPLPVHNQVLSALDRLGFVFHKADLEAGTLRGSRMPFYQEIEYWSAGEFRNAFKALELTFVTDERSTHVILEVDRPGGFLSAGGDAYGSIRVGNDDRNDLLPALRDQLTQLARRRGLFR